MANRSDQNSSLPRRFKRMIALMGTFEGWTPDRFSQVKRSFIDAHAHFKVAHKNMLVGKASSTEKESEVTA